MRRENLVKEVREAGYKGASMLRTLENAISKLEKFRRLMTPLEDYAAKYSDATNSLQQTMKSFQELAGLNYEADELTGKLRSPHDVRAHIKNMDRGQNLLAYFHQNEEHQDAVKFEKLLGEGLDSGYAHCAHFLKEQLAKYTEIYSVEPIAKKNAPQLDTLSTIKTLVGLCKYRIPNYLDIYTGLRSAFIVQRVLVPEKLRDPYVMGSHFLIVMLNRLSEAVSAEAQLELAVFPGENIRDTINVVAHTALEVIVGKLEKFLDAPAGIEQSLDVSYCCHQTVAGTLAEVFGKGAKLNTLHRLESLLIEKVQKWYREYSVELDKNLKINTYEVIHPLLAQICRDAINVEPYADSLKQVQLEDCVYHLVTQFFDSARAKWNELGCKVTPHSQIFFINSLCYVHFALKDVQFGLKFDMLLHLQKDLDTETQRYLDTTWAGIKSVLYDKNFALTYKKQDVLSRASRDAVKGKFTAFNERFPSILHAHKAFPLISKEMIHKLRVLTSSLILDGYKLFLQKYFSLDFTTRKEKYALFTVKFVEEGVWSMYELVNPNNIK